MCLTYGQVIAKYTKNNLGPSEMLSATALSCILLAIFGTEPLSVIAGTAAMMIFESSIYQVFTQLTTGEKNYSLTKFKLKSALKHCQKS